MHERRPIPAPLGIQLERLVAEYLAGPDSHGLHEVVRRTGALPVYFDMGGTVFLRPEGEFLVLAHDSLEEPETETNPVWQTVALVVGAETHPELHQLLPEKPSDATPCPSCGGEGRIRVGGIIKGPICGACHGLGWHGDEDGVR